MQNNVFLNYNGDGDTIFKIFIGRGAGGGGGGCVRVCVCVCVCVGYVIGFMWSEITIYGSADASP